MFKRSRFCKLTQNHQRPFSKLHKIMYSYSFLEEICVKRRVTAMFKSPVIEEKTFDIKPIHN